MAEEWDAEWAEAKRRCRLSAEDVRMAKELGLRPRTLIKNVPSPSQRWKAPVRIWVRELYHKRQEKTAARARRKEAPRAGAHEGSAMDARGRGDRSSVVPFPRPHRPEAPPSSPRRSAVEEPDFLPPGEEPWDEPARSFEEEVDEQNRWLLKRQEDFRAAAEYVAEALAGIPVVQKVVLFGSVAAPLKKEVPRFGRFRRAGVALWHECRDVDLAVWVSDLSSLKTLQKAQARALNDLLRDADVGVAHHQVDVFLLEPGTDRHMGRLCHFGTCPKGKPECLVPGCGASLFLQQHEGFVWDPRSLEPGNIVPLFDRASGLEPPSLDRWRDHDIPF